MEHTLVTHDVLFFLAVYFGITGCISLNWPGFEVQVLKVWVTATLSLAEGTDLFQSFPRVLYLPKLRKNLQVLKPS